MLMLGTVSGLRLERNSCAIPVEAIDPVCLEVPSGKNLPF
jgi:hypothetical protein